MRQRGGFLLPRRHTATLVVFLLATLTSITCTPVAGRSKRSVRSDQSTGQPAMPLEAPLHSLQGRPGTYTLSFRDRTALVQRRHLSGLGSIIRFAIAPPNLCDANSPRQMPAFATRCATGFVAVM